MWSVRACALIVGLLAACADGPVVKANAIVDKAVACKDIPCAQAALEELRAHTASLRDLSEKDAEYVSKVLPGVIERRIAELQTK